ncbi:MAG: hypothetical protein IJ115_02115 [Erysipelotrichaceae bacterium]|nr:hypothetical protein [Erysipelotrichaceae bacterium]
MPSYEDLQVDIQFHLEPSAAFVAGFYGTLGVLGAKFVVKQASKLYSKLYRKAVKATDWASCFEED